MSKTAAAATGGGKHSIQPPLSFQAASSSSSNAPLRASKPPAAAAAAASASAAVASRAATPRELAAAFYDAAATNATTTRRRTHRRKYVPVLPASLQVADTSNVNALRVIVAPNEKNADAEDRNSHAALVRVFTRHLSTAPRQIEAARMFLASLLGKDAVRDPAKRRLLSLAPSRLQVFVRADAGAPTAPAAAAAIDGAAMAIDDQKQPSIAAALGHQPRLRLLAGAHIKTDALTKQLIVEICYASAAERDAVAAAITDAAMQLVASIVRVEAAPALWFRFRFRMERMENIDDAYALLVDAGIPRDACAIANADDGCFAPHGRRFLYAPDVYARSGYEGALQHALLRDAQVQELLAPLPMCRSCGSLTATSRNCRSPSCIKERRAGADARSLCFRCGTLQPPSHHKQCKSKEVASLCLGCGGAHFTLRCTQAQHRYVDIITPADRTAAAAALVAQSVPSDIDFPTLVAESREDGEISSSDSDARPPIAKKQKQSYASATAHQQRQQVPVKPASRDSKPDRAVRRLPQRGGLVPLAQQERQRDGDPRDVKIAEQEELIRSLFMQLEALQRSMDSLVRRLDGHGIKINRPADSAQNIEYGANTDDADSVAHHGDADNSEDEWSQPMRRTPKGKRNRETNADQLSRTLAPRASADSAPESVRRAAALIADYRRKSGQKNWFDALLSDNNDDDVMVVMPTTSINKKRGNAAPANRHYD